EFDLFLNFNGHLGSRGDARRDDSPKRAAESRAQSVSVKSSAISMLFLRYAGGGRHLPPMAGILFLFHGGLGGSIENRPRPSAPRMASEMVAHTLQVRSRPRIQSEYALHYNRSHDAVIRVYGDDGNVTETRADKSDFKEP